MLLLFIIKDMFKGLSGALLNFLMADAVARESERIDLVPNINKFPFKAIKWQII